MNLDSDVSASLSWSRVRVAQEDASTAAAIASTLLEAKRGGRVFLLFFCIWVPLVISWHLRVNSFCTSRGLKVFEHLRVHNFYTSEGLWILALA